MDRYPFLGAAGDCLVRRIGVVRENPFVGDVHVIVEKIDKPGVETSPDSVIEYVVTSFRDPFFHSLYSQLGRRYP